MRRLQRSSNRFTHADQARRFLDEAESLWPKAAWISPNRLEFLVLRREAEATIRDAAFPADPFARDR